MEEVLSGGPWYIGGHIIDLDKWSPSFSPSSLKVLTARVWIRFPQLPLHYWDEINMALIASRIGTPLFFDGNSFNWSKKEYARICLRINLESKLPTGVWFDGLYGRFFQKVEYEMLTTFCYGCAKIGHLKTSCPESGLNVLVTYSSDSYVNTSQEVSHQQEEYGPWIHVKFKNRPNQSRNRQGPWKKEANIEKIPAPKLPVLNSTEEILEVDCPPKKFQNSDSLLANVINLSNSFNALKELSNTPEEVDADIGKSFNENATIEMNEGDKDLANAKLGDAIETLVTPVEDHFEVKACSSASVSQAQEDSSKQTEKPDSDHTFPEIPVSTKSKIKPQLKFLGLIEPWSRKRKAEDVNRIIGADWNCFHHPADGIAGAILILWKSCLADFTVITHSPQLILGSLKTPNKGIGNVAMVYGHKNHQGRRELWSCLEDFMSEDTPTLVGGDFNCLLSKEDKRGGKRFYMSNGTKEMKFFMAKHDLHDLGVIGPKFTWCNNKQGAARIWERLDRCLLNSCALQLVPSASIQHLARISSDHCPIAFYIDNLTRDSTKFFRFEDTWKSYPATKNIVAKAWGKNDYGDEPDILNRKIKRSLKALFFWNKNTCKNLNQLKEELKSDILSLQQQEEEEGGLSSDNLALLRSKVCELNITLLRISTWWNQRAKTTWNEEGDSNTRFFHAHATAKRNGNLIRQIKDDNNKLPYAEPNQILNADDRTFLEAKFTQSEFYTAVFQQGSNKSSGIDGSTASFFKFYWEIIKEVAWNAINKFFTTGRMNGAWKDTLVVLIPKITSLILPSNFRPISLCQTIYKIASTMIVNRLKCCISKIISKEQVAFIPGRSMSDHCLLALEIFNKFKISKNKKGLKAVKLDMAQAFDSMCWKSLVHVLDWFEFPEKYSSSIMECVTKVRFSILLNAKTSLSSLPTFISTHSLIPKSILLELDQIRRDFIWHHIQGHKSLHYIAWENLCTPRAYGGLGIYSAVKKVRPLRARLAWRLFNNPSSLLYKCMSAKYGSVIHGNKPTYGHSAARAIILNRVLSLNPIVKWKIVNGANINVMEDIWLLDKCFNKWPMLADSNGLENQMLQNFITEDGNWNLIELSRFFNSSMIELITHHCVINEGEEDNMELLYQLSGKSISSLAYSECIKFQNFFDDAGFAKWLWKLKLKPRVELFWWRLSRFAIPTNEFLKFRNLSNCEKCARDYPEIENGSHIVVHCKFLIEIWIMLRSWGFCIPTFSSLDDCLHQLRNLVSSNVNIVKIYCTAVFISWNCRNEVKHGKNSFPVSVAAASTLFSATSNYPSLVNWDALLHREFETTCHPPPLEWIKFNVDASLLDSNLASVGGGLYLYPSMFKFHLQFHLVGSILSHS
ncbi:hypothetical protein KFK09_001890 [Dendrobium nobile]|uniref:CCHC-type domain-containing protein n=1 Tax=Dendrobium nobile TaxID=94219 RepID=A0A8T3C6E2_DENNO|nr:hypothetical protein KFK09_001890 [Dendrobium nobile]